VEPAISRSDLLSAGRLQVLSERRDGPGLLRATLHFGLLAASLVLALAAEELVVLVPGVVASSVLWALLFGPLHESMHRTAFRTRLWNELLFVVCCALHLFAPSSYRPFHWEHHRATHHPTRDPEISPAPHLLGDFPRNPLVHVLLVTGVHLVVLKLALLVGQATGMRVLYAKLLPYIPERRRRRVTWEARAILGGWTALLVAASELWPPLVGLAGIQVLSHVVLSPLLMAEHHGLPDDGDVLKRTRSISTLRPLRYFFWNMPYHAEHHGWPSVPFHALPVLHDEVKRDLPHAGEGYLSIHWRAGRGRPRRVVPAA
jgi:fatty acid desaturase